MSSLKFEFNKEKAIEVILYISNKIKDPTKFSISKILYLADKISLERYGRFICGDTYYAMAHGPVPTHVYDMTKDIATGKNDYGGRARGVGDRAIIPLKKPNLDYLSKSDIECLDAAILELGDKDFDERRDKTHDEAYHRAWDARGNSKRRIMPIESIVELLNDSDDLLEHLQHRDKD